MEAKSMGHQFLLLLPSYGGYAFCLFILAALACFAWTKIYPRYSFSWKLPILITFIVTGYSALSLFFGLYQAKILSTDQVRSQKVGISEIPSLKDEFVKTVQTLAQNPEKISPEIKNDLLKQFDLLFPKSDTRNWDLAKKSLIQLFDCHVFFWEDAMASFKAKTKVKSDSLLQCNQANGEFFGRPKLFTEENLKSDDKMLASLAAHEPIHLTDGKSIIPTEAILRVNLDAKMKIAQGARRIFE